ncbi:MAG: hypothetical protein CVU05_10470 [Bacteroidetes bacterium HGW-Bacteroidetes-21]|jgi:protein TonB|nr:MAG: hypothetical protein CVU05_10470 [Bacteroidetes bacterium HGW-Bacteroidetes-21]
MKHFLSVLFVLLIVGVSILSAQDTIEEVDECLDFYVIEVKPEFPGGEDAFLKYIAGNTKYPAEARDKGIQGMVFIQFIIDKTGEVTDVKVLKSVDPILDKEAMRVVKGMPKWTPGKQRNKFVKVSYQVPFNFKL